MKLTMPMTITAADSEARTISGRIVAFNEAANASTGKVIFAKVLPIPPVGSVKLYQCLWTEIAQ